MTEPSTWERGRILWANTFQRLSQATANWRLIALGLFVLDVFLSVGLWHQARGSNVRIALVQVDRHGSTVSFGPIKTIPAGDAVKRYVLNRLIHDLRTVSTPDLIQQNLTQAAAHLAGDATKTVASLMKSRNPYELAKSRQVLVRIESLLLLDPEKDHWQIRWIEDTTMHDGRLIHRTWQATVKLAVHPPNPADLFDENKPLILTNPLGVYVTSLDWAPLPETTNQEAS